jgi:hypothetical protein
MLHQKMFHNSLQFIPSFGQNFNKDYDILTSGDFATTLTDPDIEKIKVSTTTRYFINPISLSKLIVYISTI